MLQIISGKFYKSEDRYSSECKGILYSNFSWNTPIKTCVATIEPVEIYGTVSSYVINYVNQMEKESNFRGVALVKVGDYEIIKQFRLLCSFGLRAYFDIEKSNVQHICRKEKDHNRDDILPSIFVRRFLDSGIMGTQEEIDKFIEFVNKVIGLKRDTYKTILKCLSAFEASLRVLDQDFNLAYSIMIYALETLSQNFDEFVPSWNDYEQNQRIKLEKCFEDMNDAKVDEIRSIHINDAHLKLTKRFVEFIMKYIKNEFYCEEAKKIPIAIKRTDVEKLLINSYNVRSRYVHTLKPLLKQISIPDIAQGDVFCWNNEPFLTFAGISRLTHHVIYNFIMGQPTYDKEDYNWYDDLPGMVTFNVAPQYWIWKHEDVRQEHATGKLEGLLSQLVSEDHKMTDIRELLKKYEGLIPNAQEKYKIQMLATYYLYNSLISEEYKLDNYFEFSKKYEEFFDICCIENMVVCVFMGEEWPWKPEISEEVVNIYLKRRYKKNNLKLPNKIELAVFVSIANLYGKLGLLVKQRYWLEITLLDCPGQEELQNLIKEAIEKNHCLDVLKFIN